MRTAVPIEPSNDTEDEGLSYRQPPHNLEAEQMLLGAILVNNIAAEKVLEGCSHIFGTVVARGGSLAAERGGGSSLRR